MVTFYLALRPFSIQHSMMALLESLEFDSHETKYIAPSKVRPYYPAPTQTARVSEMVIYQPDQPEKLSKKEYSQMEEQTRLAAISSSLDEAIQSYV